MEASPRDEAAAEEQLGLVQRLGVEDILKRVNPQYTQGFSLLYQRLQDTNQRVW